MSNETSNSQSPNRENEASTSSQSRESSSATTSSSAVREEEERREEEEEIVPHQQHEEQQIGGVSYGGNYFAFDDSSVIRDDTWSCLIVVLTFWFFVSMTLILGVYGSTSSTLGPNCSVLIQPNPIFVQSVKVQELDGNTNHPLTLYAFYKSPSLDVVKKWSKIHNLSVPSDSHKELTYFLNEGSEINISYSVKSPESSVFLVIAQGNEGLVQWLEDPTYPNTTLSWNVIHGSGTIQQDITKSSSYYVAVGNLNSEEVEVQLNISIRALLYNTTQAYYKCGFSDEVCNVKVLFPNGNTVVLTSPTSQQDSSTEWYVKLSYGPRWGTYVVGTAVMTVFMLLAFNFLNNYQCFRGEDTRVQYGEAEPERDPLLSYKDDDLSSWGSSYDSVSNDEEDLQDLLLAGPKEGTSSREGENGNNTRRLCAICFDAPRDCFFLPCGHCVACFACGTRIAEAAGTCPICRRTMKKVRKIFTV